MAAWLLTLMLLVAPPERFQPAELSWVAASRYADIAEDVAAAVAEAPPLFGGPRGRERTAVLLLAVAWRESGWQAGVDTGETRGGGAWGLWQIIPANDNDGRALVRDRRLGARAALRLLRQSYNACKGPDVYSLAAYTSGSCTSGLQASKARWSLGERWFWQYVRLAS